MLVRNFDRDIYTMDEGMRYYLRHLRFWNHMLLTHEINYVFFNNTPHHTHDYADLRIGAGVSYQDMRVYFHKF